MHMCPKDFERKRKYHSVIGDLFVFTLYLRKRIRLETDSRENFIGQNKKSIGWPEMEKLTKLCEKRIFGKT